jgi:hypothetical protein
MEIDRRRMNKTTNRTTSRARHLKQMTRCESARIKRVARDSRQFKAKHEARKEDEETSKRKRKENDNDKENKKEENGKIDENTTEK